MKLWNVIHRRTTREAKAVLDLDLREVMLDLDPGMLAWSPPPTR